MKSLVLKIVNWKLKLIAKYTLGRYKPKIIGITGSVGKTSTKNAIYTVLSGAGVNVRMAGGNLNNETGLPLAIIGDYQKPGGFWLLAGVLWGGFWRLLSPGGHAKYPKVLILEYAADHPGDLDYLIRIARPDVAIVTAIGEIPVHSEFYSSTDEITREKAKLVKAVPKDGAIILNADDPRVVRMGELTQTPVITFGFNKQADLVISNFKNILEGQTPRGVSFSLNFQGDESEVNLRGVLGKSHAYACAASAAVGLVSELTLLNVSKWLGEYAGERGRGKIIEGVNGTIIIDESYNAAPDSTKLALETLSGISAGRKIAVLGDMLELGDKSKEAHRFIGTLVTKEVDVLITVGGDAKMIGEEAVNNGLDHTKAFHFDKAPEAGRHLKDLLRKGDVVLIKGSQSIRTEKIVKDVMQNPTDAPKLLVRQYGKWLNP